MATEADSINKTNLIINYLPQCLSDEEFYSLFTAIGPVYSARIIRDRSSGYSHGYGFVKFQNAQHASMAIDQLNGLTLLNKHIKVAYSLPAGHDSKNINVYVKGLAPSTTNESMKKLFEPAGQIIECRAIPDKITGLCQGIGFVLFSKKEEAEQAIKMFNNKKIDGSTEPLLVKFAKKDQKNGSGENNNPPIAQSATNYPQSYGGSSYSANGSYGTSGYNNTSYGNGGYGNNSGYGSNSGYEGNGGYGSNNFAGTTNHYSGWGNAMSMMGSAKSNAQGGILPGGGPVRGMVGARGRNLNRFSPMTGPRFGFNSNNSQNQGGVPDGFIVFVYGIGPQTTEAMLWSLCCPYGDVKRVNVIVDHQKQQGKGYGFVTFATLQEASYCINQLNGTPFEGKQLQVSLKNQKA